MVCLTTFYSAADKIDGVPFTLFGIGDKVFERNSRLYEHVLVWWREKILTQKFPGTYIFGYYTHVAYN